MPSQTVDFLVQTSAALAGQFVSLVSNKDGVTKYTATVASDLTGKWIVNPKPPAGTYTQWIGASQGALTTQVDQDFVVDPFDDLGNANFPGYITAGSIGANTPATGDVVANRGGATPGTGAIYFGSSAGLHSIIYNGGSFVITDNISVTPGNLIGWGSQGGVLDDNPGAGQVRFYTNTAGKSIWINAPSGITLNAATAIQAALTVAAGGAAVTGNSSITGTFNVSGLFSANGSIQVVAGTGMDTAAAGQLYIGPVNATSIAFRGPQKSLIVGKALTSLIGTVTVTAAQLLGGIIEGTPTAAASYTLDTAANIDAAIPVANGDTFTCYLLNQSAGAFAITILTGAGVTLKGNTAAIAQNKSAALIFRRTGVGAWTCYILQSL
jgi:hypothetical protein